MNINGRQIESETVLEIGKFAILWNIFEKEKCNTNCNIEKLRTLIQHEKTNQHWRDLSQVFKNRVTANASDSERYVDTKLSIGIGLNEAAKQEVKDFIENTESSHLLGGLIAIYRIRNNMYHGLKDWTALDSQIELFRGINKFLEYFLSERG